MFYEGDIVNGVHAEMCPSEVQLTLKLSYMLSLNLWPAMATSLLHCLRCC